MGYIILFLRPASLFCRRGPRGRIYICMWAGAARPTPRPLAAAPARRMGRGFGGFGMGGTVETMGDGFYSGNRLLPCLVPRPTLIRAAVPV
jgi:hypothetical protein